MATLDIPVTKTYIQTQETTAVATVNAKIAQYDAAIMSATDVGTAKQQKINLVGQYNLKWNIHTDTSTKRDQIIAAVEAQRDGFQSQVTSLQSQVTTLSGDLTRKLTTADLQSKQTQINTILNSTDKTLSSNLITAINTTKDMGTAIAEITTVAKANEALRLAEIAYTSANTAVRNLMTVITNQVLTGSLVLQRDTIHTNRFQAAYTLYLIDKKKSDLLTTVVNASSDINKDLNSSLNLQTGSSQNVIKEVFGLDSSITGPSAPTTTKTPQEAIAEIKRIRGRVTTLEGEGRTASGALSTATSDAEALRSRITTLEGESQAASGARASTLEKIRSYKAALNQKSAPNTSRVTAVKERAAGVKTKTSSSSASSASQVVGPTTGAAPAAAAMKGGAATTGDPILDAFNDLQERVDQREADFATYQTAAEGAAAEADDTITTLETEVATLTGQIQKLQTGEGGVQTLQGKVEELQSAYSSAIRDLTPLTKELTGNDAPANLSEAVGNANTLVTNLHDEIQTLKAGEGGVEQLRGQIQALTKEQQDVAQTMGKYTSVLSQQPLPSSDILGALQQKASAVKAPPASSGAMVGGAASGAATADVDLRSLFTELQTTVDGREGAYSRYEAAAQAAAEAADKAITTLLTTIGELTSNKGGLAETVGTLTAEVARLQPFEGQAATLQTEVAQLQSSYQAAMQALSSLAKEITGKEIDLANPNPKQAANNSLSAVGGLREQVLALQLSYQAAMTELSRLSKELTGKELNSVNPNLKQAANNSLSAVGGLRAKIGELTQAVASRGSNLTAAEAAASAAAEQAAGTIQQLQLQLQQKNSNSAAALKATADELNEQINRLAQELQQTGANLGQTKKERDALTKSLQEAQDAATALQGNLALREANITAIESAVGAATGNALRQVQALKESDAAKNTALSAAQSAATAAAQTAQAKIDELNETIKAREANVEREQLSLQKAAANVKELEALLDNVPQEKEAAVSAALAAAAQEAANQLEEVKASLRAQRNANVQRVEERASGAIAAAEAATAEAVAAAAAQITAFEGRLEGERDEAKAEAAAAKADIEKLRDLLEPGKQTNISRLEGVAQSVATRIRNLQEAVTQKTKNLNAASGAIVARNAAASEALRQIEELQGIVAARERNLVASEDAARQAAVTATKSIQELEEIVVARDANLSSAKNAIRLANEAAIKAAEQIQQLQTAVTSKDGTIKEIQEAAAAAAEQALIQIHKLAGERNAKSNNLNAEKRAADAAAATAVKQIQELQAAVAAREANVQKEKGAADVAAAEALKQIEQLRQEVLAKNGTIESVQKAANTVAAAAVKDIAALQASLAEKTTAVNAAKEAADGLLKEANKQLGLLTAQLDEKNTAIEKAREEVQKAKDAATKEIDELKRLAGAKNATMQKAEKDTYALMQEAAKKIIALREQLKQKSSQAQASLLQELAGLKRELEEERRTARLPSGTVVIPSSDAKTMQDSLTRVVLELRKQSFGTSKSLQKLLAKIVLGMQSRAGQSSRYQTVKVGGGGEARGKGGKLRRTRRRMT
jgi:chromosome segregation ATPase